jgi:hypothetical protein
VVVATVLGVLVGVLSLIPRLSVTPSDPTLSTNPFSSSFTITNTGYVPLRDVGVTMFPFEINSGTTTLFDEKNRPPLKYQDLEGLTTQPWEHHELPLDERFTITLGQLINSGDDSLKGADIALVVHFKPWFIPWKSQRQFRFVTRRQQNGAFLWFSQPMQ